MFANVHRVIKVGFYWSLALGIAVAFAIQLLTWMGLGLSPLTWVSTYILVILFAVLSGAALGRAIGARPGLVSAGAMIAILILASRIIFQIYMLFYITYIDPSWVDATASFWQDQLRDAGQSDGAIKRTIEDFRMQWTTDYMFTIGIIRYGAPQFILGLIAIVLTAVRPWRRG